MTANTGRDLEEGYHVVTNMKVHSLAECRIYGLQMDFSLEF